MSKKNQAIGYQLSHLRNEIFYVLKPVIPRRLQLCLRRQLIQYQLRKYKHIWPIDQKAGTQPAAWPGWPDGKKFAIVLTHDVDSPKGYAKSRQLMELDERMGFRSSFNFVPLRYAISPDFRNFMIKKGFEIGVHGLYHDGKYYLSKATFLERAEKINAYLKEWNAVGYRAPAMYHKLTWFHAFNIEYDASTFDTDPFEPHAVGAGTIFPFMVIDHHSERGYVELPYTLPQDFTLFTLMREKNIDIWKKKLAWIVERGGMALINTHPDYMHFDDKKKNEEEYPASFYEDFLKYVNEKYAGQYWHALPKEVAEFWKKNYSIEWLEWKANTFPYYNHNILADTKKHEIDIQR